MAELPESWGKPFAGPDAPGYSHCWDCGFTWETGKDGSHSCVGVLQALLAHTWIIPHWGDPYILCRKPADEVEPGGCLVGLRELYSRIGDVEDLATDTEDPVQARALVEEAKRLRLLHLVLSRDLAPAVPK
jgi:hypothetical protein